MMAVIQPDSGCSFDRLFDESDDIIDLHFVSIFHLKCRFCYLI